MILGAAASGSGGFPPGRGGRGTPPSPARGFAFRTRQGRTIRIDVNARLVHIMNTQFKDREKYQFLLGEVAREDRNGPKISDGTWTIRFDDIQQYVSHEDGSLIVDEEITSTS